MCIDREYNRENKTETERRKTTNETEKPNDSM